jgi:hypothetical protein
MEISFVNSSNRVFVKEKKIKSPVAAVDKINFHVD